MLRTGKSLFLQLVLNLMEALVALETFFTQLTHQMQLPKTILVLVLIGKWWKSLFQFSRE
jgi:hypothetical protein